MKCASALLCLLLLLLSAVMVSCSFSLPNLGEVFPFHEHQFGDWATTASPTCTEPGVATRACRDCGFEEAFTISANGHVTEIIPAVAPTCTEDGQAEHTQCKLCDALLSNTDTFIAAVGHTPSEPIIEKEPDCTTEGLRYVECTVCAERLSEEVDRKSTRLNSSHIR